MDTTRPANSHGPTSYISPDPVTRILLEAKYFVEEDWDGEEEKTKLIHVPRIHRYAALNKESYGDLEEKDQHAVDKHNRSALFVASYLSCPEQMKRLLDLGLNPNAVETRRGYSLLHVAVEMGDIEMLRILLDCGADTGEFGLVLWLEIVKAKAIFGRHVLSLSKCPFPGILLHSPIYSMNSISTHSQLTHLRTHLGTKQQ